MFNGCCKKLEKYFIKNPVFNGLIHVLMGIGLGYLTAYPLVGSHPVRWGLGFLVLAGLGYLWAMQ